jgi:hypothetical protein
MAAFGIDGVVAVKFFDTLQNFTEILACLCVTECFKAIFKYFYQMLFVISGGNYFF